MKKLINDSRVIFTKGKQQSFLIAALKKSRLSWSALAKKIGARPRTLNNWKREKYSIPLSTIKKISIINRLKLPTGIKILNKFWYTKKGGKIAGKLVYEKYGMIGGDPVKRKRKWLQWWNRKGKFNLSNCFIPKEISEPKKSVELAEFVGIMMGDGGITQRQITVTLNYKTDKEYITFVKNLIKKLFWLEPALYKRKNQSIINIVISRTLLVLFCESVGLKIGNKLTQKLDIPKWIKDDKKFKIACIRGLMDTDGCIFNECHVINNKKYCYPRLSFVSFSWQLRLSVFKILQKLDFSPKIRNNRSVQLEKRKDIINYFSLVNTNNLKHRKRFESFFGRVG